MLRRLVICFSVLAIVLASCGGPPAATPTAIETLDARAQTDPAQGGSCPRSSEVKELVDGSVFICLDFASGNFWQQVRWPAISADAAVEPEIEWLFAPGVEGSPVPQLDFWPSEASKTIYYYSETMDGEQMWSFVPVAALGGAGLVESLFATGTVVVVETGSFAATTSTAAAAGVVLSPVVIIGVPVVGLIVLCIVVSGLHESEEVAYYEDLALKSIEAQAMKPHRVHSSGDHSPYVLGTIANIATNILIDRFAKAKTAVASGASNGGWGDSEPPVCGAYVDANGFVRRVWWWVQTKIHNREPVGVLIWAYVYQGLPGNFGGAFDGKFKNALKNIPPDLADRGWKVKIYKSCDEAEFEPGEFNPPPR